MDIDYGKAVEMAEEENAHERQGRDGPTFGNKTRLLILVLSIVCLVGLFSNAIAMNFTVICMDDVVRQQWDNSSSEPHWLNSPAKISLLFSANAVGSLLGTMPYLPAIEYIGVRKTMSTYGFISGISTILMPPAVAWGYAPTLMVRILQGTGTSIIFSLMGAISEQWSILAQTGTFISVLSSSIQISNIVTMPLAGFMCESSLTWRGVFYSQGAVTILAYIIFYIYYRDCPSKHRHVSEKELGRIKEGKMEKIKGYVPFRAIFSNKCIMAICLSVVGGSFGFFIMIYYGPTYLNKVLGLDVKATGFATSLPYVIAIGVKFVAGPLSDYATCLSEKSRLIMFASGSQGMFALSFAIMALTDSAVVAQIVFTAGIVFTGFNVVGTVKCTQLVARQYAYVVMLAVSVLNCAANLFLPTLVATICPTNAPEEWSRLFIAISVIVVFVNIPFVILASAESADFTKPEFRAQQKLSRLESGKRSIADMVLRKKSKSEPAKIHDMESNFEKPKIFDDDLNKY
ncbi:hypothetical protein WR25_13387 isoform A [Diploscapter pachys]|uniref:Major facilitator superfamily (MFS) profile domain-containing protein n=2 Tax=Diploscapter pachys TaxID=2018661 RepID=A0A2A2J3C3_9BILA|nr:hypothetical protein WR25_13387 isoform A [Diploscapter pachys]